MLSSLRNFLLSLIISLAVFGMCAYFILGYVNGIVDGGIFISDDNNTLETNESPFANGEGVPVAPEEEYSRFTVLIVGIDNGESQTDDTKKEADTIILVNVNSKTKKIMISPLTCEMNVKTKGYSMRLGAVYADYGIETLLKVVGVHTRINPDYYCVFNYDSIRKLFEIWGNMEYNVPMDMYYMPKLYDESKFLREQESLPEEERQERKPEINLKAGMQEINGEQAVQLLRFKNYTEKNEGRIAVQIDFIQEVLRQKITFENLEMAKEIFTAAKNSVTDTNIDEKTFENYKELIFSLSTEYETKVEEYPGYPKNENGVDFFIPNLPNALKLYSEYNEPISTANTAPPPNQTEEETADSADSKETAEDTLNVD